MRYWQMLWMVFFRPNNEATSRADLFFSSAQSRRAGKARLGPAIHLALDGGDDIKTVSPKPFPYFLHNSILSGQ